jgi:hypothetical protein
MSKIKGKRPAVDLRTAGELADKAIRAIRDAGINARYANCRITEEYGTAHLEIELLPSYE